MPEKSGLQPNPWLSDLIGGFLIDLARAQHLSNEYSKELAVIYKRDPLLRVFPVPNGYITGCDVELRIAVEGVGSLEAVPQSSLRRASDLLSEEVASLAPRVAQRVSAALAQNAEAFGDPARARRMAEALLREPLLPSLRQRVEERLQAQSSGWFGQGGAFRSPEVLSGMEAAFDEVFVDHPDYSPLPDGVRARLREEVAALVSGSGLAGLWEKRVEETGGLREPSVAVAPSAEVLPASGPSAAGQVKLNASVRDFVVEAWDVPGPSDPDAPQVTRFKIVPAKR